MDRPVCLVNCTVLSSSCRGLYSLVCKGGSSLASESSSACCSWDMSAGRALLSASSGSRDTGVNLRDQPPFGGRVVGLFSV